MNPAYFRPSQAPEVLGVSRWTLDRWRKKGLLTYHKKSGITLVSLEDCRKIIEDEK